MLLQPDPTKILSIELGIGGKLKKRVVYKDPLDLLEHHIIYFVKEFQHSFKSFSERGFVKNMVMTQSFIVCEFGILAFKIFS
jgi:hypothetical protein